MPSSGKVYINQAYDGDNDNNHNEKKKEFNKSNIDNISIIKFTKVTFPPNLQSNIYGSDRSLTMDIDEIAETKDTLIERCKITDNMENQRSDSDEYVEEKDVKTREDNCHDPKGKIPDGGWGWVVCFAAMIINGTVFGVMNSFGIIFIPLVEEYAKDDPSMSFKTSWVGSVCAGVTFLMTLVAGILCDVIGMQQTAVLGAVLGTTGLVSSAFVTELELMYLTYGVILGTGAAFIFTPSLVILGHYFSRHIGLANGLVAFGNAFFSILLSLALPKLLDHLTVKFTFLCLGGLYFLMIFAALTFKPLLKREGNEKNENISINHETNHFKDCCTVIKKRLNVHLWKNRAYAIWVISIGISLFGYFIPFVHLVKHAQDVFPDENGNILITILQVTSALARLIFGKISDLKCVNRVYLQQMSIAAYGIVTVCIPFSTSFYGLIIMVTIIGISDGIFVFIKGPIAVDIVGPRNTAQAFGFLFLIYTVPFAVGPPLAGLLYDHLHTYQVAFHCAGAIRILGALVMFFMPKVERRDASTEEKSDRAKRVEENNL